MNHTHKRTLAAACLVLLVSLTASAQVKFGVKGGVELLDMKFAHNTFNASNRSGWFVGPQLVVGLPLPGLGFDLSALYNQRTSKIDLYDGEMTQASSLKTHQIAVPLNLRYTIKLGPAANIFVYAGPQVAFHVGDDEQQLSRGDDEEYVVWRLKSSNFSVNGGLGLTLGPVQLSANYNVAVGNTGDVTWHSAIQAAEDGINGKYSSWQLSAAFFF